MATSILDSVPANRLPSWQESMKLAIRDSQQLLKELGLPPCATPRAVQSFPVFVPREYLRRIEPGNAYDPLLLQVLPLADEDRSIEGFTHDPVGDSKAEVVPGVLHKYLGRVLLIVSGACGINCRYCFRRHYPYGTAPKSLDHWETALAYIQNDTSINEVILSGGDPLTVVDPMISALVDRMEQIPHIRRLRIHTRMPVVIPQRVTKRLCEILGETRLSTWVVLHINHANEVDQSVEDAIRHLQKASCNVLNQAVLLKGVNDSESSLVALFERLIDCQVVPYYLNQLDRVAGASHYDVSIETGRQLMEAIRNRLPGYAIPHYVQDQAGFSHTTSKTVL